MLLEFVPAGIAVGQQHDILLRNVAEADFGAVRVRDLEIAA